MLEVASQIGLCLAIAGLLGLYIGYLLGKDSCNGVNDIAQEHCE